MDFDYVGFSDEEKEVTNSDDFVGFGTPKSDDVQSMDYTSIDLSKMTKDELEKLKQDLLRNEQEVIEEETHGMGM